MSYEYEKEKTELFTDEGQRMFLKMRDATKWLLDTSGAATAGKIMDAAKVTGSSWTMLACIDRMVELGEIKCIWDKGWAQHAVYVRNQS